MKRWLMIACGLAVALCLLIAWAHADEIIYGTTTINKDGNNDPISATEELFKVYHWTVTSAGELGSGTTKELSGFVVQLQVSGSSNYEVELQDERGYDRLGGLADVTTPPAVFTHDDFGYYSAWVGENAFPVLKWTSNAPGEVTGVTLIMVP